MQSNRRIETDAYVLCCAALRTPGSLMRGVGFKEKDSTTAETANALEPGSTVKVEDSPSAPIKRHERTAMATPCELAEWVATPGQSSRVPSEKKPRADV